PSIELDDTRLASGDVPERAHARPVPKPIDDSREPRAACPVLRRVGGRSGFGGLLHAARGAVDGLLAALLRLFSIGRSRPLGQPVLLVGLASFHARRQANDRLRVKQSSHRPSNLERREAVTPEGGSKRDERALGAGRHGARSPRVMVCAPRKTPLKSGSSGRNAASARGKNTT